MSQPIHALIERIALSTPAQTIYMRGLLDELRALRGALAHAPSQGCGHCIDAAILLMEFMTRSEGVANADAMQVVAWLVRTIDDGGLCRSVASADCFTPDVTQHPDLRLTHECLLGSILVEAKVISTECLERALQLHVASSLPLGRCLIHLGAATPEQIASAVAFQDGLNDGAVLTRLELRPSPERQGRSPRQQRFAQTMHANVLGEVLIRLGVISSEQLESALRVHLATDLHIGEALVQTGATTWEQVKRGLELQKQLRSD